jgi:broad specificity phosphatase PhoE
LLILVRHGQTVTNAEGRLLGRADPPLTELGKRQAAAVAKAIGPVDRVVSSPLARAQATAACFGVAIETDERWIEIDYGVLENQPLAEVSREFWDSWRADPSIAPEGGESLLAVGDRVWAACEELTGAAASSDVVVVSHVSPIKAAIAWALGGDHAMVWRMYLDVAAVSRIAVRDHGPVLVSYDERIPVE